MSDLRYSSRLSPLRAYSVPCPIFVQLRIHSMTPWIQADIYQHWLYLRTSKNTLHHTQISSCCIHHGTTSFTPSGAIGLRSLSVRNWTAACEPMAHQIANELTTMNATVLCFNSLVRLAATLRFEILLVASSAVYCRRVGAAPNSTCRVSYYIVNFGMTPTLSDTM